MTARLVLFCDATVDPYGICNQKVYLNTDGTGDRDGWMTTRDGKHRCPLHNPAHRK